VLVVPRCDPGRGVRLDSCTAMCAWLPACIHKAKNTHIAHTRFAVRYTQSTGLAVSLPPASYSLQEIFSGRERAARHRKRSAVAADGTAGPVD
jgi:hypothetical protein